MYQAEAIATHMIESQRFQKLTYLHLFTDCFMKISPQLSEQTQCVEKSL